MHIPLESSQIGSLFLLETLEMPMESKNHHSTCLRVAMKGILKMLSYQKYKTFLKWDAMV